VLCAVFCLVFYIYAALFDQTCLVYFSTDFAGCWLQQRLLPPYIMHQLPSRGCLLLYILSAPRACCLCFPYWRDLTHRATLGAENALAANQSLQDKSVSTTAPCCTTQNLLQIPKSFVNKKTGYRQEIFIL